MTRKPAFLPRKTKRRKVRYHILIPFLILCALLLYAPVAIYQTFFQKVPVDPSYTVCGLNVKKSKELLSAAHNEEGEYEIKDHVFYGEHLGLYAETYDKGMADPLLNKSITFQNICNEESFVYVLGSELDMKIPLYELPVGYYEVYVSSLMKQERMYANEILEDEFFTISRKGKNNKITLLANPKMYYPDDEEFLLTKPYLFIEVKEEALPEDYYDIVLDAGHNTNDLGSIIERGHGANGLIEAEENMKATLVMKEVLEAAGLKVKLAREENQVNNTYGEGGRVEMVFKHHAKYYISNHLNALNDTRVRGSEVFYSSFSSTTFAESVLNAMIANSDLTKSGNIGKGNKIPSILPTSLYRGIDGKMYDDLMMIREPGGRALGAGQLSEKAKTENGPFINGTNYGAQAILIEYLYMSNVKDVAMWKSSFETYATAAANGIIEYLRLDINDVVATSSNQIDK